MAGYGSLNFMVEVCTEEQCLCAIFDEANFDREA